MKRTIFFLFIVTLSFIILPHTLYAKLMWSRGTGWMDTETLHKDTPHQRFRYATSLMINEKYVTAASEFQSITDKFPNSELAEPSQFNAGHAYYLARNYVKAFEVLDELLIRFPGTRRRGEILEKAHRIATAQMEVGTKKAISMFEKIINRNPLGPTAVDSQVKIAECHFRRKEYEEAVATYEAIIENYPKSEWVPYAQFQIPTCKYTSTYSQDRNVGLLAEAREGYEEYMAINPTGTMVEEARKMVDEIKIKEADKTFNVAEFYYRRKKPEAAVLFYNTILQDYPDTIWAVKAEKRLEFFKSIGALEE